MQKSESDPKKKKAPSAINIEKYWKEYPPQIKYTKNPLNEYTREIEWDGKKENSPLKWIHKESKRDVKGDKKNPLKKTQINWKECLKKGKETTALNEDSKKRK